MIMACATNDGEKFSNTHFGDAERFDLYKVTEEDSIFIKRLENHTESEEQHADPKKAKGIANLLKSHNVQVGISKQFGPNIKRVSRHFLPVIVSEDEIGTVLRLIVERYSEIVGIINNGEQGFLRMKDEIVSFIPIQKES